jgi:phosphoribosylglycinamide formyltransferase-1
MNRPVVAILASGSGTTAEAFIRASAEGRIEPQAGIVICNNKSAGIFERIKQLNSEYGLDITCLHIGKSTYPPQTSELLEYGQQTAAEEEAILKTLTDGNFDAIALMGYMKKMGSRLVQEFGWRSDYHSPYQAMMLNTHPGVLPATKGLFGIHVQEYTLNKRLPEAGQSLHIVAKNYDEGPVVMSHAVAIHPDDTPDSLFDRVKAIEKQNLPFDIAAFIEARRQYFAKK